MKRVRSKDDVANDNELDWLQCAAGLPDWVLDDLYQNAGAPVLTPRLCHEHPLCNQSTAGPVVSVKDIEIAELAFDPSRPLSLAHIVVMREGRNPPGDMYSPTISHLCHNINCVNVDHLIWEESWQVESRKKCPGQVDVGASEIHPVVDLCSHTTKCIYKNKVLPL